jgi:hypothetical protein
MRMKTVAWIFGGVLAAATAACGHSEPQAGVLNAQAPAQTPNPCPLTQLTGRVEATVADMSNGVAVTFTGPESATDQVRSKVRQMADANARFGDAFASCPCGRSASLATAGATEAMPGVSPSGLPSALRSRSGSWREAENPSSS